jgi:uncharacterized OsmC-like protein
MTATLNKTIVNGINTTDLKGVIDAVIANPAHGQTSWRVTSRWAGGTRSDHHIESCRIGETEVTRNFTLSTDEPVELCGTNRYANPQDYLLSALNACMMVGYAAIAALMGVSLTSIEVRTTGDIDLRGFLGIDPAVPAGYESLQQTVRLIGDGTPEQMAQIHERVQATSPNFFNLTRAVPVTSRLIIG